MEIIAELEPTARGPYCGAIGWLGVDGWMDTSITIRTFAIKGGRVAFQAGGGIVADSDPAAEYEETLDKAQGADRGAAGRRMILLIDNYDSFVWNLARYVSELGHTADRRAQRRHQPGRHRRPGAVAHHRLARALLARPRPGSATR